MSLRLQAAADLVGILEDASGFGWPITVTSPEGVSASVVGSSTDIGQTIDPETGMAVSGRRASVVLALSSLAMAGLGIPRGIADSSRAPWTVTFNDIGGTPHTYKVQESAPDRAIGCVRLELEAYRSA